MLLTIDLDYFRSPKKLESFLNDFHPRVKDFAFTRNHHELIPFILSSKQDIIINVDTHDDLNDDYLSGEKVHCGSWAVKLLSENSIKKYVWIHPCEDFVCCGGNWNRKHELDGWWTVKKYFGNSICKFMSVGHPFMQNARKHITHVGVCISPSYLVNDDDNCWDHKGNWRGKIRKFANVLFDYCKANKITLNGYDPDYYAHPKRMDNLFKMTER